MCGFKNIINFSCYLVASPVLCVTRKPAVTPFQSGSLSVSEKPGLLATRSEEVDYVFFLPVSAV